MSNIVLVDNEKNNYYLRYINMGTRMCLGLSELGTIFEFEQDGPSIGDFSDYIDFYPRTTDKSKFIRMLKLASNSININIIKNLNTLSMKICQYQQ